MIGFKAKELAKKIYCPYIHLMDMKPMALGRLEKSLTKELDNFDEYTGIIKRVKFVDEVQKGEPRKIYLYVGFKMSHPLGDDPISCIVISKPMMELVKQYPEKYADRYNKIISYVEDAYSLPIDEITNGNFDYV